MTLWRLQFQTTAVLMRSNTNHRRWVSCSKVQMMILSKYTRLCLQGTSEASRCHLSIGKDLLSAGIVFDELSVKSVFGLSYSQEAKHCTSLLWCCPFSGRFSFSFQLINFHFILTKNLLFTPLGSGDAILCADHPILGQAVIVLHLDYPNCYES